MNIINAILKDIKENGVARSVEIKNVRGHIAEIHYTRFDNFNKSSIRSVTTHKDDAREINEKV